MAYWYKWVDVDFCKEPIQTSRKDSTATKQAESRCEQVSRKLRGILHEHDDSENRKKAGLDKSKRKKERTKRSGGPIVPNASKFDQIYKNRKKELKRKTDEERRKQRTFHPKPVPNFSKSHKILENRLLHSTHSITIPVTPNTLVKSMETNKKLEKLRQSRELEQMRRPKIQFNSTAYMKRQPFVPKFVSTIVEPKPFQLRCGNRAEERKVFNERAKHDLEVRCWKYALDCAVRRREEFLKLRKMTNFKARPNPWKRIYA